MLAQNARSTQIETEKNTHPLPGRGCVSARLNSCSVTPSAPSRATRNFGRKIFSRSAPQQPHDKHDAVFWTAGRTRFPGVENMFVNLPKTMSSLAGPYTLRGIEDFPCNFPLSRKLREETRSRGVLTSRRRANGSENTQATRVLDYRDSAHSPRPLSHRRD